MTTEVSLLPGLEAGLGKVLEFRAEHLMAAPNSCSPRG